MTKQTYFNSIESGRLEFRADVSINHMWTKSDLSDLRDAINIAIRVKFHDKMLLGTSGITLSWGDDNEDNQ